MGFEPTTLAEYDLASDHFLPSWKNRFEAEVWTVLFEATQINNFFERHRFWMNGKQPWYEFLFRDYAAVVVAVAVAKYSTRVSCFWVAFISSLQLLNHPIIADVMFDPFLYALAWRIRHCKKYLTFTNSWLGTCKKSDRTRTKNKICKSPLLNGIEIDCTLNRYEIESD